MPFSSRELVELNLLSRVFPNLDTTLAEIARLSAELTLPKGTVHVISDVHGQDDKLRHVINNASGSLRPLVEHQFKNRLSPEELEEFLTLIFYPREVLERLEPRLMDSGARRSFSRKVLLQLFELIRILARRYPLARAIGRFPAEYRGVFQELLYQPVQERDCRFVDAVVDSLLKHERVFHLIQRTVQVVRDLAMEELILAGDCWDRGHRGDRVVDHLMEQPNLSFVWGNHDAEWLGAGMGHEALIASVLRISLRYRRLSQLEEGYGVTLQPLERLARTVYGDDPARCFLTRGKGLREPVQMARMQKAASVLQFKLEGQLIERHPEFELDSRRLLHRIDRATGTIEIDGKPRPLRDTCFPTLDPARPYELSGEEQACMDRIRQSFLGSRKLRDHLRFLVEHGSMYLCRDDHLIFHGCVPVDDRGEFLPLRVDGKAERGRDLFDAIDQVLARCLDRGTPEDADFVWYLWCGPRSPLFGKNKMATLENDLVDDPATHVETKNAYFRLIHEPDFCDRVMREFGVDPARGIIVNGHVPVKIEKGESPLKRSGKAITIDGAFSEAYGDHGYTLVLEPDRTFLAQHHHFESVEAAVRDGIDIIPAISPVRQWERPRQVADTERGQEIQAEIELLERLAEAYRSHQLRQENFPLPAIPVSS
ncbi:MAG: fructose-bisphosphatase class III [Planctomycetes bacterium]|nr:fructose-bisphosphatase class III [Planctomycetota bacterium]